MAYSMMNKFRHLMTVNYALLTCAIISSCLLLGAFFFEYVGGLAPCKMCIWQRWAHAILIFIALSSFLLPLKIRTKLALLLVFFAALTSALIAGFHAGVEWQLWDGPSGCTAPLAGDSNMALLVDQLLATPVVRCDEVPWSLFGISMAGWNGVLSLDIAGFALTSWISNNKASRVQKPEHIR